FFSSSRRHTISKRDWSSDVCSSDLQGTGGYCFEHVQLMAGVLERLGLGVRRRLGRVHSEQNTRTHMCLDVELDDRHWMMDPGFGLSLTGPIPRSEERRVGREWVDGCAGD